MSILPNDNNQPAPEVTEVATKEHTAWDLGWGVHDQTASAWDFDDNDGEGPESEEDDGDWAGLSDPANPDEQSAEGDTAPVNPQDRRCWAPQPVPIETPRGGW